MLAIRFRGVLMDMITPKTKLINNHQGHFGLKLILTRSILKSGNHVLNINLDSNLNEQTLYSKFKYISNIYFLFSRISTS